MPKVATSSHRSTPPFTATDIETNRANRADEVLPPIIETHPERGGFQFLFSGIRQIFPSLPFEFVRERLGPIKLRALPYPAEGHRSCILTVGEKTAIISHPVIVTRFSVCRAPVVEK